MTPSCCCLPAGLSCFTTGTVVMFVLLFATSWFKNMPKSAQGAIVTSGIISLFNWQEWWFLWKVTSPAVCVIACALIVCRCPAYCVSARPAFKDNFTVYVTLPSAL